MTDNNYNSAKTLKDDIAKIVAVQTKNATTGARVHIRVTNASGEVLVTTDELIAILGSSSYNTICNTALTSVNTALASAKTSKDTAFAAI